MKGRLANGEVSLSEKYITYAKNIFSGNYLKPIEIVNDEYLVTFTGGFYPLDKVGGGIWSHTLYNNNTIFTYSMADKKRKKQYQAKGKIFNLKRFGDGVLALETDGTNFFYEIIKPSDMKVMNTVTYNMNTFSAYRNRNKNEIIKKFLAAAPKDYPAVCKQWLGKSAI